jgi:hypothetical protein
MSAPGELLVIEILYIFGWNTNCRADTADRESEKKEMGHE